MHFNDFDLDDDICHSLADMGFSQPTSIQALVIPEALEGRDIMASAPTGTGKTAAFIIPLAQFLLDTPADYNAMCRSLVLVPTRELAIQVAEQASKICQRAGLKVGAITGGINYGTDKATIESRPDILVATPGRLLEHIEKETLDCREIQSLVLDEADRMLDMGFSSIVNQIASEARWRKQSMLFSATLEGKGVKDFAKNLLNEPAILTAQPPRREKAKTIQWYHLADSMAHKDDLLDYHLNNTVDSCIIFVKTRDRLHTLRDRLSANFEVSWLQGEMPQDKRNAALAKFKAGEVKILIATDVAARGIDIPNVSHVINYDMPRTADVYVHRVGRTGRAGAKGTAISLVEAHDFLMIGKASRYMGEPIKARTVDGLKPKNKAPSITKKPKKKKASSKKKTASKRKK